MFTPFETIAALGAAALVVQALLPHLGRKQAAPPLGQVKEKKQGLEAGRDLEHVNQAGRDIHIHPAKGNDLLSVLKEVDLLREQSAHLRKQNRSLAKQNTILLGQLEFKSGLVQSYHTQLLDKDQRISHLERKLKKEQMKLPFFALPVKG